LGPASARPLGSAQHGNNDQTRARRSHRIHRCRFVGCTTRRPRLLANAERARAPHYIAFIAPRFSRHECPTRFTTEPARSAPKMTEQLTRGGCERTANIQFEFIRHSDVPSIFQSSWTVHHSRQTSRDLHLRLSTPCFLMRAVFCDFILLYLF
ncbi:hypothetical protein ALC53_12330, partial [Atta colombica]